MRKYGILMSALAIAGVGLTAVPSYAKADPPVPVVSRCHQGWYVNPDEKALLPKQTEAGFLFDGPSLVHRLLPVPVAVKDAPTNGGFTATVTTGVAPLFKMETAAPYSTINKTAAGTYWSSKIASGPGSQAEPSATLAALATLAPYGADSKVYSFGVGYGNDTGNKATVSHVAFGQLALNLACAPVPSSSASTSASATPSSASSAPVATAGLPLTGAPVRTIVVVGVILAGVGVAIALGARRRRTKFVA